MTTLTGTTEQTLRGSVVSVDPMCVYVRLLAAPTHITITRLGSAVILGRQLGRPRPARRHPLRLEDVHIGRALPRRAPRLPPLQFSFRHERRGPLGPACHLHHLLRLFVLERLSHLRHM